MCRPKRAVDTSSRGVDLKLQSLTLGGAGAAACFIKPRGCRSGAGQECESEANCVSVAATGNQMAQTWDATSGHGSRYDFRE
jgi:hypothetical protein